MRLWIVFFFWLPLACPLISQADSASELIEILPTGVINWTQGNLVANGDCFSTDPEPGQGSDQQNGMLVRARRQAEQNLLETLGQVRIDANRNVSHLMALNEVIQVRLEQMTRVTPQTREKQLPGGGMEVTLQMTLLGGPAQLMLPMEIKQVEAVTPIVHSPSEGFAAAAGVSEPQAAARDVGHYTGLILDARGIGARPVMVPLIVDESGKEVYGAAFVSREYAVQIGICQYVHGLENAANLPRVAPAPLVVKGLRTLYERNCDIVISNSDAAKLRDASANLTFLRQCRVIIVMD